MKVRMHNGLLAEFETPEKLLAAVNWLVQLGYSRLDTFTPYPLPRLEEALRLRRSRIPLVAFLFGATGAALAYGIQWYCNAYDYPLLVGGFAPHSPPAYIPIVFETCVLFASLSAFFGVLLMSGLPRLWHPTFEVEGFESASLDRYWLGIDAADDRFDAQRSAEELREVGALRVLPVGGGR